MIINKSCRIIKALAAALMAVLVFIQPISASSVGEYARQGAVVGRIMAYSPDTDTYIVYGRMSTLTDQGYRVFETGKFYKIKPNTRGAAETLPEYYGQGVKAFGNFELLRAAANQEVLLVSDVAPYDPKTDEGIIEPAYGEGIGPFEWTGFGIPSLALQGQTMEMTKATSVIDMLAEMETILLQNNRAFTIENGNPAIVDLNNQKTYSVDDIITDIYADPAQPQSYFRSKDQYRKFYRELHGFWQKHFRITDFIEQNKYSLDQASRAVKGSCYIYGLRGKYNNMLEDMPAIRPDSDKFMSIIERQPEQEFTEWASPAVFYGKIENPVAVNSLNDIIISWGEEGPEKLRLKWEEEYIGPYFPESRSLIGAIVEAAQNGHLNADNKYKQSEKWPIGWSTDDDKNAPCPIPPRINTVDYPDMTAWISGTRVLVYLIHVSPPGGEPYSYIEYLTQGKLDVNNPPPYTTIRLIGHYIAAEHIISKPAYNFMLTLLRELALKGGV